MYVILLYLINTRKDVSTNKLTTLQKLRVLKKLDNLRIVDYDGNPIKNADEVYHFVAFINKQIIFLNGKRVSDQDRSTASTKFEGKLTLQGLSEHISTDNFKNLKELDLQSMKLKELECFRTDGDLLVNLRKLNLCNNELTSAEDLIKIKSLTHLNLSNNKIKKLFAVELDKNTCVNRLFWFLEYLSLSNNLVSEVTDLGLSHVPNLKVLHLQSNKLEKVRGF